MTIKLHDFPGGLVLDDHKTESTQPGLQQSSLPERIFLPLRQHIGEPAWPLVKAGERVRRGQVVADNASRFCAPVHATTSGVVRDIREHPVAHPSGQNDRCIVIEVDGDDTPVQPAPFDPSGEDAGALIERICRAGIVGLGGAAFPTSPKLLRGILQQVETLIINGVECEPYISCDDVLMRNYPDETLRGVAYLQQILEPRNTIIALEENKPEALASMKNALAAHPLEQTELVVIPTRYPSGGEKQLVQILSGREVPQGKLKAAKAVLDTAPVMGVEDLWLCQFCSDYYHHPIGEVIAAALPRLLRSGKPLYPVTDFLRATEAAETAIGGLGRAPKQAELLTALLDAGGEGLSADALAELMPAWRRVAKPLVEKGLAVREESAADDRQSALDMQAGLPAINDLWVKELDAPLRLGGVQVLGENGHRYLLLSGRFSPGHAIR